jgi:tRNA nucleotidyltransferase (CCA-adding enzyme)
MNNLKNFYLCGGAVRDSLLNVPSKDNDFVVLVDSFDAMREEILRNGGTIFIEKPEYLTIRGTLPNYGAADFVLPRSDGEYSDGRRPDTTSIADSLYLDSCRRDFTIGAMYKNLETGEIIDYHNGKKDLENKLIRCVGNTVDRFREDYLRVLRAVRFSITKRMHLSDEIKRCLDDKSVIDGLQNVSAERIRDEAYKCFKHDSHSAIFFFSFYSLLSNEVFNERTGIWLKPTMEAK